MAEGKKSLVITQANLKSNFLLEKNFGLPKSIFEKKIDLCKKGDEITPFDGTTWRTACILWSVQELRRLS